jgi:hypothetical protein
MNVLAEKALLSQKLSSSLVEVAQQTAICGPEQEERSLQKTCTRINSVSANPEFSFNLTEEVTSIHDI